MGRHPSPDEYGEPALQIAGLQVWIHGREFPDASDYDDGNWLRATAHAGAKGASIWVDGSILRVPDIAGLMRGCQDMLEESGVSAKLEPLEPELEVSLEVADRLGHVTARVEITPDNLTQRHSIEFEIDQSYLPHIIQQCEAIMAKYPVKGK